MPGTSASRTPLPPPPPPPPRSLRRRRRRLRRAPVLDRREGTVEARRAIGTTGGAGRASRAPAAVRMLCVRGVCVRACACVCARAPSRTESERERQSKKERREESERARARERQRVRGGGGGAATERGREGERAHVRMPACASSHKQNDTCTRTHARTPHEDDSAQCGATRARAASSCGGRARSSRPGSATCWPVRTPTSCDAIGRVAAGDAAPPPPVSQPRRA
jgi:hypothetical protein